MTSKKNTSSVGHYKGKSNPNKSRRRTKNSKNKVFSSLAWHASADFKSQSLESINFLSKTLVEASFVVFDIETTGGNPDRNGITEIFGIKFQNGQKGDTFYSMVNPKIPIPRIVRKMTGITNAMVKDAPTIDAVMPDLVKFLGDSVLVSHNTIGDLKFLRHFAYKVCGHNLNNFYLCTHLLSEKLIGDAPDKSLKGLCNFLGFSYQNSHRAETDTFMTLDLFKELLLRLGRDKSIYSLDVAIRYQGDLESSLRLGWGIEQSELAKHPKSAGLFYLYDREGHLLFYSSSQNLDKDIKSLANFRQLPKQLLRKVLSTYTLETKPKMDLLEALIDEVTDKRFDELSFSPSKWHLRVIHVIKAVKSGNRFLISVGRPEINSDFMFGKIYDKKEAFGLLQKIAKNLDLEITRKGFYVDENQKDVIFDFFNKKPEPKAGGIAGFTLNPVTLFFRYFAKIAKSDYSKKIFYSEKLREISSNKFQNLLNIHGVVVAGEQKFRVKKAKSKNGAIKIYPVKNGVIFDPIDFSGPFEEWSNSKECATLESEIIKSLNGDGEIFEKGPHEGRLNVGLWVATSKFKKNEYDMRFIRYPFDS